ncbi:hypothetical protein QLX08_009087 [Tetragonisca angustula]|uniref:Uncharacterized protein n=1 Tax=Tetragonisca angustula TaxID=166442 RepID=A0AAW0ZHK9_9HYME
MRFAELSETEDPRQVNKQTALKERGNFKAARSRSLRFLIWMERQATLFEPLIARNVCVLSSRGKTGSLNGQEMFQDSFLIPNETPRPSPSNSIVSGRGERKLAGNSNFLNTFESVQPVGNRDEGTEIGFICNEDAVCGK